MDDLDRLRFACRLAATVIMKPETTDTWEHELRAFFEGDTSSVRGAPVEWHGGWTQRERLTAKDWENLRHMAKALVDAATGRRRRWGGVQLQYGQRIAVNDGRVGLQIEGTIASTFARVLTAALVAVGVERFRLCQRCDEPFVAGRSDNVLCDIPGCVRARQYDYITKYAETPKGRRTRQKQVAKLRRKIAETRVKETRTRP